MDASPVTFAPAPGPTGSPGSDGNISLQWAAVQDAASVIAMIAGAKPEAPPSNILNFAALIEPASGWRAQLVSNQVNDMAAMLQSGLSALLALNARGLDGSVAAMALWQEYLAAAEAVFLLLSGSEENGSGRSA